MKQIVCPVCYGNNGDLPCAYPGENLKGCIMDSQAVEQNTTCDKK